MMYIEIVKNPLDSSRSSAMCLHQLPELTIGLVGKSLTISVEFSNHLEKTRGYANWSSYSPGFFKHMFNLFNLLKCNTETFTTNSRAIEKRLREFIFFGHLMKNDFPIPLRRTLTWVFISPHESWPKEIGRCNIWFPLELSLVDVTIDF